MYNILRIIGREMGKPKTHSPMYIIQKQDLKQ